jgi:S-adenosylmethionine hydrolase
MIFLFTDFGPRGPYLGQMTAVLQRLAPEVAVIDLLNDAPAFAPRPSAYLLAALLPELQPGDVLLAVVDPGVGTERAAIAIELDGRWVVAPDNGLVELAMRRTRTVREHVIVWRPERLSASFHGRDLFAPVAAALARGDRSRLAPASLSRMPGWPDDAAEIIYVDAYGNAMTGLRAESVPADAAIELAGRTLTRHRTFGDARPGSAFWYENSLGLVEIAANGTSAADLLGLQPGTPLAIRATPVA